MLHDVRGVRLAPCVAAVLLISTRSAVARRRPLFEPTDLEMESPGEVELDLQFGAVRGEDVWRTSIPDMELDIGLGRGAELDIDGAFAVAGAPDGSWGLDHTAPDDLWLALKLGIYDEVDDTTNAGWAIGTQLGPKLPVARDSNGMGYEALVLVGRHWQSNHLVLNAGGLVDPGPQIGGPRPMGVEAGIDVNLALGGSDFSMTSELAGVRFFSADPHQLHASAGITWATSDRLDVSVVGLVGLLRGGDRGGVLIGFSPKLALWK